MMLPAFGVAMAQTVAEKITVSGNCGMCKKKIESAAKEAGAKKAEWDADSKVLTVKYNQKETSNDAIQKKVAETGYDTEKYTATMDAYNRLHSCCQYDNKRKPVGDK
ncbi:MAG: cation transporter [Taibaiella sp.]|nr:cation transporter [Taibaiella sp.]